MREKSTITIEVNDVRRLRRNAERGCRTPEQQATYWYERGMYDDPLSGEAIIKLSRDTDGIRVDIKGDLEIVTSFLHQMGIPVPEQGNPAPRP